MNHITNLTELKETLDKNDFTILKFSTNWCGPCKRIAPVFENMSKDNKYSLIYFAEVDMDESPDICKEYIIDGLPTFILFKKNEEISRFSGADESKLRNMLDLCFHE
jgi:thioredoxin 1